VSPRKAVTKPKASKKASPSTGKTQAVRSRAAQKSNARVSAKPTFKPDPAPEPVPGVSTVSFISLGCPKNLVDSEKMLGLLAQDGILPIPYDPADTSGTFGGADAVVVNTCGFLEASKDESLGVIKEAIAAKERGDVQRVVVAGCLVQRHRAKMLEWAPGIDSMIGVFDRDRIVSAVRGNHTPADGGTGPSGTGLQTRAHAPKPRQGLDPEASPTYWIASNALTAARERGLKTAGLTVNGKDGKGIGYFEDDSARLRLTPRHYAYLRISEGCNQNCAFCTIPSIRGKMRSKPMDRITAEAAELVRDGAFELNLIGQDTTSYGDDLGLGLLPGGTALGGTALQSRGGLPAMLKAICDAVTAEGGSGWVRLMYAYPSNFSGAMIDAFASLASRGTLLPYIDMPLQHASDRILTAMRRNVTCQQQHDVIRKLRERVPGMAIRTTFISGFPGETEADHKQLLEFVEESQFENLGVFDYSREPGTVAGTMEEDLKLAVSQEDKARRKEEIMLLQQRLVFARHKAIAERFDEHHPVGTGVRLNVLIDEPMRSAGRATAGVGKGGQLYKGRTSAQAPMIDGVTFVQSAEKLSPGEVVPCVIVGWDGYDLIARPASEVDEPGRRVGLRVLKR
jgi:ribosomal protein S12 methylthiotransferase